MLFILQVSILSEQIYIYINYEINHDISNKKRGKTNTGNFDTKSKGKRTKVQKATQGDVTSVAPKTGMTGLGM